MENPYYGIGLSLFTGIAITSIGFRSYYSTISNENTFLRTANTELGKKNRDLEESLNDSTNTLQKKNADIKKLREQLEYENKLQESLDQQKQILLSQNSLLLKQIREKNKIASNFRTVISNTLNLFTGLSTDKIKIAKEIIESNPNAEHLLPLLIYRNMALKIYKATNLCDELGTQKIKLTDIFIPIILFKNEIGNKDGEIVAFSNSILELATSNKNSIDGILKQKYGFVLSDDSK